MKILFCFLILFQSKNISVVDVETNKPIPFVSFIGLQDRKGGYADENGVIYLKGNTTQSFIVSCVGYETDTVSFEKDVVRLKSISINLATLEVSAKKAGINQAEIGFFKKNTSTSFGAQAKYEFYTFIANPDTTLEWQIKSVKIPVRGHRKNGFEYFKIRPLLKDVKGKIPNKDLLVHDVTVNVYKGQSSVTIELPHAVIIPKEGCFVGMETIGFSIKNDEFSPFSDYLNIPSDDNVVISIPLRKAPTRSFWRVKNGKGWFGSPFEKENAFAFGLEVLY